MAVQPSNPCPECDKVPDIPDELPVPVSKHQRSAIFWCNRCGTKLAAGTTDQSIKKALSKALAQRPYLKGTPAQWDETVKASEFSSGDLEIQLWRDPKRQVFVSYSHKDDDWCQSFVRALESAGFGVFKDSESIRSGEDWVQKIEQRLKDCHFFVPLLTPDASTSAWVQQEIGAARAAQCEIIPVLLKDAPLTGFLQSVQWLDVRGKTPEQAAELVATAIKNP